MDKAKIRGGLFSEESYRKTEKLWIPKNDQRSRLMENQNEQDIKNPSDLFLMNLNSKKDEIETAIENLKEKRKEYYQNLSSDDFMEEVDRAEKEISLQHYYGLLERKYAELKRIETLIEKISEDKNFGLCEECGEMISPERLSVMPDATRCITCQREYEKFETQMGNSSRKYKSASNKIEWDSEETDEPSDLRFIHTAVGEISMEDFEEMEITNDGFNKDGPSSSSTNDMI
jgi:DnaK suppressor protein